MLVVVAPGQGSQTPGFLQPWLELPGVADRLAWWSAVTGIDLIRYGTTADADEIRDTAVAQPLLVSAALAAAFELFGESVTAGAVAGHSVGELAAAAMAGVLSSEAALVLVRERGAAMKRAGEVGGAAGRERTGMTALLGGDLEEVLASIDKHGLTPANINATGQIVAAGTDSQLAALADEPPAGARLRPLKVAGAFHTDHMEPAAETLRSLVAGMPVADLRIPLLSNLDGAVAASGPDVVRRLVTQVSAPVRWDSCMATMASLGTTAVIELPPAGTLSGLIRRELPEVTRVALKTPDDLDKARTLISEETP